MKGVSLLIMRWGRATRAQKKIMIGSSCKSDELSGSTNGRAYKRRRLRETCRKQDAYLFTDIPWRAWLFSRR